MNITKKVVKYPQKGFRQIIRLSNEAVKVLEMDCAYYGTTKSNYLNTIIQNYCSEVSIQSRIADQNLKYTKILMGAQGKAGKDTYLNGNELLKATKLLTNAYESEVVTNLKKKYKNDQIINIRMRDSIAKNKTIRDDVIERFKGNRAKYYKYLLEQFLREPRFKREYFFYKGYFDRAKEITNKPCMCLITFTSSNIKHTWYVAALRTSKEYESDTPFLLGLTSYSSDSGILFPCAIPLRDIKKVEFSTILKNKIDKKRLNTVAGTALAGYGKNVFLAYANNPHHYQVVIFDDDSMRKYNKIKGPKPICLSKQELSELPELIKYWFKKVVKDENKYMVFQCPTPELVLFFMQMKEKVSIYKVVQQQRIISRIDIDEELYGEKFIVLNDIIKPTPLTQ